MSESEIEWKVWATLSAKRRRRIKKNTIARASARKHTERKKCRKTYNVLCIPISISPKIYKYSIIFSFLFFGLFCIFSAGSYSSSSFSVCILFILTLFSFILLLFLSVPHSFPSFHLCLCVFAPKCQCLLRFSFSVMCNNKLYMWFSVIRWRY